MPLIENDTVGLLKLDDWLTAPDGRQYRMVWGRVRYIDAREAFGFDPKVGSNVLYQVGDGDGALLIAGCQVHYAFACAEPPHQDCSAYIPPSEREFYAQSSKSLG